MVPHDQHLSVALPGMINDDLDSDVAIKNQLRAFGRELRATTWA